MRYYIDLTGIRVGKLTVLEFHSRNGDTSKWLCRCDCGTIKPINARSLRDRKNPVQSCGCSITEYNTKFKGYDDPQMAQRNAAYGSLMRGAKTRNLVFQISFNEFLRLSQMPCTYCKSPELSNVYNPRSKEYGRQPFYYNGLDRVDNSKGYIPENVVPCCKACNRAKNQFSKEQFIRRCETVAANNSSSILYIC